jgi:hypothetical protein
MKRKTTIIHLLEKEQITTLLGIIIFLSKSKFESECGKRALETEVKMSETVRAGSLQARCPPVHTRLSPMIRTMTLEELCVFGRLCLEEYTPWHT